MLTNNAHVVSEEAYGWISDEESVDRMVVNPLMDPAKIKGLRLLAIYAGIYVASGFTLGFVAHKLYAFLNSVLPVGCC